MGTPQLPGIFDNKNIFLALTYKCNAFCKKCMTRNHSKINVSMSKNTVDCICNILQEYHYTGLISIGSGEPLLYDNLPEIITRILSINESIQVRILSNGMLFNSRIPNDLFNSRCIWGITMDGFTQKTVDETQRGINIETVKSGIISVVSVHGNTNIYLNYTLSECSRGELLDFCMFSNMLGISDVHATELKIYQGYEHALRKYKLQHNSDLVRLIQDAKNVAPGLRVQLLNTAKEYQRKHCFLNKKASPIIDVDGEVCFCAGHEDVYIGNIADPDVVCKWDTMASTLYNSATWCESCHSRPLNNGLYTLPRTINI